MNIDLLIHAHNMTIQVDFELFDERFVMMVILTRRLFTLFFVAAVDNSPLWNGPWIGLGMIATTVE